MTDLLGVILALVVIGLILVYQYLTFHFNAWNRLGVPGPKPKIYYGSFPSSVKGERNILYDVDELYMSYKDNYPFIGVFMTRDPEILILDPKLAYEVMVTNFGKFRRNLASKYIINKKVDKFSSRSPFFAPEEEWKSRRADVLGGIIVNKLVLAAPIWKESAQKLSQYLKERTAADGKAILETKDLAYHFTARVMCDMLWGIDSGSFKSDSQPNTIIEMAQKLMRQTFVAIEYYYATTAMPFLRRFSRMRFFPAETDHFFSQLTKDALAMRAKDGRGDRVDYLNYMIQMRDKKNLSHDDIMGNILTVWLDGFETSANAIFHTMFYLAKYPVVQEKLRAEILANTDENGEMSFDTLNNLPFLDQCLHETIRLVSPIPTFARICTEHTTLELGPQKRIPIKVGTVMNVPIFSYHHDPKYFPDPYVYKPERFDNAAHLELIKTGVFMPFGSGPRICLGMRAGLFQAKTFLAQMLREYRITCCAKTMEEKKPDSMSFILALDGDIWLQYERL